jgi:hypothetical protein
MSDDPTSPIPSEEPDPGAAAGAPLDPVDAASAPLDHVDPAGAPLDTAVPDTRGSAPSPAAGSAARDLALGAIAFVAVLLLLLGATRLMERGATPTPSATEGAAASASASAAPPSSASPASSGSPGASASSGGSGGATPTASDEAPSPVLVGAGDIAACDSDGDEATAKLLDGIAGTVFTTGDNAYDSGTPDQFRECYEPTWGRHRDRTRPAPGNHDWETADLGGYMGYFGPAAQGPDGSSWYSYDLGTWHVIVLDSVCRRVGGCGPDSAQGRWLAKDLAANDSLCTMAIFHHPRFSSGEHGDIASVDAFWRPLYAANVDVIVNGHDHDYERFAPQDPDGRPDEARGIRQFVVGTGGGYLRNFTRVAPNSEARLAGGHGVLKFTLHEDSYDAEFIAADNDFRDVGTEDCH